MAHNTHIPWTLLSSQFKFLPTSRKHNGQTNLHPRNQPKQGSELNHFCRVFAQTIASFSASERSKYPSPMTPPDPDEVVISENTAKKISKTVTHYRSTNSRLARFRKPLSLPERQMSTWIAEHDCTRTSCRDLCCCGYAFDHSDISELAKTLLLYGEIETLLRIQAHPDIQLDGIWMRPGGVMCSADWALAEMMRCALMSYVFFNVVYLHPETWEAEAREKWMAEKRKSGMVVVEKEMDYRKMVSWEKVVGRCTGSRSYDVHTYPHRLFFGISEHEYQGSRWNEPGCGREFRKRRETEYEKSLREKYLPHSEEVDIVLFYLQCKGLPAEIGLQILAHADFKPERRLPIANDPLHPRNRGELRKYLSWCWRVLVWCDVLMTASEMKIGWVYEITDVIRQLWGSDGQAKRMFRWLTLEEAEEELYKEDENGMKLQNWSLPGHIATFI